MAISDEEAREWARYFLGDLSDYEYSNIYEDEEFTDEFPDEEDWRRVRDTIRSARVTLSWDD